MKQCSLFNICNFNLVKLLSFISLVLIFIIFHNLFPYHTVPDKCIFYFINFSQVSRRTNICTTSVEVFNVYSTPYYFFCFNISCFKNFVFAYKNIYKCLTAYKYFSLLFKFLSNIGKLEIYIKLRLFLLELKVKLPLPKNKIPNE